MEKNFLLCVLRDLCGENILKELAVLFGFRVS